MKIWILCTALAIIALPLTAEIVHIPDANLRSAVAEALDVSHNTPISEDDMNQLTDLELRGQRIANLTGLEFATNLRRLFTGDNPKIADLNPIASLRQLEYLDIVGIPRVDITPIAQLTNLRGLAIAACRLVDISAVMNMANLIYLDAGANQIVDITPLANLTNLTNIRLNDNRIVDITPLANLNKLDQLIIDRNAIVDVRPLSELTQLQVLEIHKNRIVDHSPLDGLSLSHFVYDQACEMPPLPLEPRVENRNYPSLFARWSGWNWPPISNRPELSGAENLALHDLRFSGNVFGVDFREVPNGFKMMGDVQAAKQHRDELIALNPNAITLVDVGIRAAPLTFYPEDSPYWIRDAQGNVYLEAPDVGHGLLDFTNPVVQDLIVDQAVAVSECGLYDGIFFDYWSEAWTVLGGFRTLDEELAARDTILQRIRASTRPNFLIMGNVNVHILPRTAPYVNGGFMETVLPFTRNAEQQQTIMTEIEDTLLWLDTQLREPRINGVEGWAIPTEPPDSPTNLRWMRAFTTLSLTHSDGYMVFTQPEKWTHYWYDFWGADLGRPMGEKGQLYQEVDGLYIREFTNGWAVYNHSGETQVITIPEETQGVASGRVGAEHTLPNLDGEMYLRMKPENPADVNGDGAVNILDLVAVAQGLGTDNPEVDVNEDGVVNVFDLVFVAGAIGGGGAAPSASSLDSSIISAADVERWLTDAQGLGVGDANFQRGIRFLEGLLAALTPKETTLLPNYPNPFNPETWIPYRLAREAEVAITIYDTKGTLVRRLALGHREAGHYAARGKAAYWDGRNEDGEAVASRIYIYQFRAEDYAASRRMVIVK